MVIASAAAHSNILVKVRDIPVVQEQLVVENTNLAVVKAVIVGMVHHVLPVALDIIRAEVRGNFVKEGPVRQIAHYAALIVKATISLILVVVQVYVMEIIVEDIVR